MRLKKSLGQHFLHDENVCQQVVDSVTHVPGMRLLEVGPGGGAITKYFAEWPDVDYKAYEIDEEKVRFLDRKYPQLAGRIELRDILTAPEPWAEPFTVAGNFPYNISSAILFQMLEWEPQVVEIVGMFQKEVARRIASGPGSKEYGILSVLMGAFFSVEYLFDVPPTAFTPPPKVMSGVVRFKNTGNPFGIPQEDRRKFKTLVKAAFGQRRKTLRNALKSTLPPEALESDQMTLRAEQLSVADFVKIHKQWQVK
jgi:16S rRNA (adenine1518-N6/adenine1519-N6)-dimethyltransferase